MRFFFLVSALSVLTSVLHSQDWIDYAFDDFRGNRELTPKEAAYFSVSPDQLREVLFTAPHEREVAAEASPTRLRIPLPDGSQAAFRIVAYDVVHPNDAARFPEFGTWYGVNTENPGQTIFLDWTARGFHASLSGGGSKAVYLDPLLRGDIEKYQVYYRQEPSEDKAAFLCESEAAPASAPLPAQRSFGDCVLREYSLAVSATHQYSNYHGATSSANADLVQSAVVTSINRVNQVFSRDVSLRFQLVAGNDQLYFYAPEDDPFSANTVSALLNENTGVINDRLGEGTYDLGHAFTQGGNNGLARLRSGCSEFWPGAGATSLETPEGDFFNIDYVAHEIGHQLGANHTQNNSCNYSSRAGMEPGSASTIMGYAGICAPNVQANSDDYFHGRSIQEMTAFIEVGEGGSCATIVNTSLNAPSLSGDSSFTVPFGTPLRLAASVEGNATLSHNWEQYDVEQAAMPPRGTSALGPLFRSFSPTTDTFRYLPTLLSVFSGFDPVWEEIPMVSREMNFRMTSLNQNATYGCAGTFDVEITVDGDNGPFSVTDPATGNQWSAGQVAQVRWDVAGTNGAAFESPTVDILITYNNGLDLTLLAANEPNDGYAEVTVPDVVSSTAKILIRSTENIFYNVSPQSFQIVDASGPAAISFQPLTAVDMADCFTTRDTLTYALMLNSSGRASELVTLALDGFPSSVTATFQPNTIRPGGAFTLVLSGLSNLPQGVYNATLSGSSPEATDAINISFTKIAGEPGSGPELINPANPISITRPSLSARSNGMDVYEFEVATDAGFQQLIFSSVQQDTFFVVPDYLSPNTTYYWRVRTRQNNGECAISLWSEASFLSGPCYRFDSEGGPKTIGSGPPPQVTEMPLHLPVGGTVRDLDVAGLNIDHTYVGDLRVELLSPSGTTVELINRECGSNNDMRLNLDDEGDLAVLPCPPIAPTAFLPPPAGDLSVLNGEPVNGNWVLRATDLANQDGGTLNSFGLVVCIEDFVLPVTFLDFTATPGKQDILLQWATEAEENNRGFYIERTTNSPGAGWTELGFVAAGTQYRFNDASVQSNTPYFYRLRQTDLDGRVAYSDIREASIGDNATSSLLLYPNPMTGILNFHRTVVTGPTRYRISDLAGRVLIQGTLNGQQGTLSLPSWPAGVYWLRTDTGETHRIVKH